MVTLSARGKLKQRVAAHRCLGSCGSAGASASARAAASARYDLDAVARGARSRAAAIHHPETRTRSRRVIRTDDTSNSRALGALPIRAGRTATRRGDRNFGLRRLAQLADGAGFGILGVRAHAARPRRHCTGKRTQAQ